MARSLNRATLIGNLGRDAETGFTPSGISCTKFSVATERRWQDKQSGEWKSETDWHNCVLWRAENLAQYLTKGKQVYVEGRIQTRSYEKDGEKRYATEIIADNVLLLGGNGGEDAGQRQPAQAQARPPVSAPRGYQQQQRQPATMDSGTASPAGDGWSGVTDDDMPF